MQRLRILYHSFSKTGGDKLLWKLDASRLRILCYHGICEDRLAKEPWIPEYFVTESAFEKQLQYLKRNTQVLSLEEAVERLGSGTLPARSVCLTFDDGYANNLEMAYPLLQKFDMPATIFLSTAYMESGEFFPFLKLKLIRLDGTVDLAAAPLANYKSSAIDEVEHSAARWWGQVRSNLTSNQVRTLRPLRVEEIQAADSKLVRFGAHSHTHCILRNESDQRRQAEIQTSIRKVAQWTGRACRLFSYPNGQRGDFGEVDRQALRAEGIQAAVTGIGGANNRRSEMLGLRRYPVALYHDEVAFRAEVTGFRTALLSAMPGRVS
jgi:peptidoglycan/xylan/chitin deacetylase (PgdA/CDA1 family)